MRGDQMSDDVPMNDHSRISDVNPKCDDKLMSDDKSTSVRIRPSVTAGNRRRLLVTAVTAAAGQERRKPDRDGQRDQVTLTPLAQAAFLLLLAQWTGAVGSFWIAT